MESFSKQVIEQNDFGHMSRVLEKLTLAQDLKECATCKRYFATDRIKTHEAICQKSSAMTKKYFDITQQRIKRTEAEKFPQAAGQNDCFYQTQEYCQRGLSSNWRSKHEDFMKKIKDAKILARRKDEKQSDLAFSTLMNNEADNDYVQCQHCCRKFSRVSAARHVGTCATRMCTLKSKTDLPGDSATKTSYTSMGNE